MHIKNKLPNLIYLLNKNALEVISGAVLGVCLFLDELKTIVKQYPEIPLQKLLLWTTKNGADFLGFYTIRHN